MKKTVFSRTASIEFQGPKTLEFITLENGPAEFDVIGFEKPKIHILDYRPETISIMQEVAEANKVELVAPVINRPGKVIITNGRKQITVTINKPRGKGLRYMLWAPIGIGEGFPAYNYVFLEAKAMEGDKFAVFSVFSRPRSRLDVE